MGALKRREAREFTVGLLFESEFRSDESTEEIYPTSVENREIPDDEYVKTAYFTVNEKKEEIDKLLNEVTEGWKTSRMNRVDLTILRLATYEIKWDEDVPTGVAINEAVELAKKYSSDDGPSFINGVLAKVAN